MSEDEGECEAVQNTTTRGYGAETMSDELECFRKAAELGCEDFFILSPTEVEFKAYENVCDRWERHICKTCATLTEKRFVKAGAGTVHYGVVRCAKCDAWIAYIPRPSAVKKRPTKSLCLSKHGQYCEMCLRLKSELPNGQTITGHHVHEHQHGGSNEENNIWDLCTGCHELVTWVRRRHGHNEVQKEAV